MSETSGDVAGGVCVLVLLAVAVAPVATAGGGLAYDMSFAGTFRLYPVAGEGFTDELYFGGEGNASPFGAATVDGYSRTENGPDGCATIVHDEVTVALADGEMFLVNAGRDCVDVLGAPGHVVIHGMGTTEVVGGRGAYEGARGTGTWTVTAEVTGAGPGHLQGVFDALRFAGTLV